MSGATVHELVTHCGHGVTACIIYYTIFTLYQTIGLQYLREISVWANTPGQNSLNVVKIRYVPATRDMRPFISLGEDQCFFEALEVLRVKPTDM